MEYLSLAGRFGLSINRLLNRVLFCVGIDTDSDKRTKMQDYWDVKVTGGFIHRSNAGSVWYTKSGKRTKGVMPET